MLLRFKKLKVDDNVHKCTLDPEENIMVRYISGGYCVKLRRAMKQWTMVSEMNPRSKIYLKSAFNIRREKILHLESHYYMIHPFSSLKCYWEFLMIIIFIILLTVVPIQLCVHEQSSILLYFLFVLDIFCLADMVMIFNSGYQDSKTKKVILSRKMVARNYFKTWFTSDFLSVSNVNVLFLVLEPRSISAKIKFCNVMKILRIFTLIIYMNRFREYYQYSLSKFKLIKLFLIMVLLLLWSTCLMFILANQTHDEWLIRSEDQLYFTQNMIRCFIEIFNFFFLVNHYQPKSLNILVVELSAVAIGVILQMFFLSQIMQITTKYKISSNRYNDKNEQLHNYMQNKQVPKSLVKKSQDYFDFKFQRSYYRESTIVQTLSSTLRDEIRLHIGERLLKNVDMLKDIPASVTMMLTSLMEQELYIPNDIITRAGDIGNCMYFISSGMVAVYTPGGKEVSHIANGGNFGEVCMVMEHSSRVATVVAVDYCDVYVLSKKNFYRIIEILPELYDRVMTIAKNRMTEVIFIEHARNRPLEFHDLRRPEGSYYFKQSLYEL